MKRDGSRAKVYSGCNLMVLERTSRPSMRQVPWGDMSDGVVRSGRQ
ncbi:hypothetical protein NB647_07215 [Oxalobacter aliiformigenes]|nr:hypothetical protein [Oxalobacter aliiformigenes]WAV88676.1 hypothetical protein NB647_07215 [Oxalobacter aliiformigenes]